MYRLARVVVAFTFILTLALAANMSATPAIAGTAQNYLVLYKGNAVAADVITRAGGTLVASYNAIGVAVARSSSATFAADVRKDNRVEGAAATAGFATRLDTNVDAGAEPLPGSAPATDNDNLSGLQWDMTQIHTPEAHAITGGSPAVVVATIDTGVDYTHPDLAANMDDAKSANCVSGLAVPGMVAADDDNGHGTHTAGTIAAASNGIGIVGVAPNVKIASIKAGNAAGFFFPEAVICAHMWAGSHNIDVTNNSYFADPWLYNCKNDPEQRAIWKAERRAISYAMSKGTVVVAAEGNESDDLAHPTQDVTSPDNSTPVTREITNACAVVPVEVAGVIGVTANGVRQVKSYYSSYGMGKVQVIAPGGDRRFQTNTPGGGGRVLSTYPAKFFVPTSSLMVRDCSVTPCAVYAYLQGTSMAAPHVAGVAALIKSQGVKSPGAVAARINNTADPLPCPSDMSIYANFPSVSNGAPQVCTGGTGYNSFNGHGQVNALNAVR
jgi:lantibiotic leader peptide-processing serine protease